MEVKSSMAFDSMGIPLPHGLYDERMGPYDKHSPPCVTCGCPYASCPGHSGRIELSVPVYHPLLLSTLLKLLKCKCFACHKLRIGTLAMNIFQTKFSLLQQGRLQEALELDRELAKFGTAQMLKTRANAASRKSETEVLEFLERKRQQPVLPGVMATSYDRQMWRELTKALLAQCMQAKNCPHCGAYSPKIRVDSANKIFQTALSKTARRLNQAEGIELHMALKSINIEEDMNGDSDDEDDEDSDEGYQSDDSGHRTKTKRGKKSNASGSNDNDSDSMDVDDADADDDLDDDSDDEDGNDAAKDKFMQPMEVQAQLKKTWKKHRDCSACAFRSSTSRNSAS